MDNGDNNYTYTCNTCDFTNPALPLNVAGLYNLPSPSFLIVQSTTGTGIKYGIVLEQINPGIHKYHSIKLTDVYTAGGGSGAGGGPGGDQIATLFMHQLMNQFPPNSVIVINGEGGNGNWCGPGTPYMCVYQ